MKCEESLKVIEEYFDGELDAERAAQMAAHLAKCEACARELEELRDEQNLYALYRRDVEVTPALWTSVTARIREEKAVRASSATTRWRERLTELFGTPRLSPALAFALLILAVGATAGLMKYLQSQQSSTSSPQAASQKRPQAQQDATAKEKSSPANVANDNEKSATENGSERFAERQGEDEERVPRVLNVTDKAETKRQALRPLLFADEEATDRLVREAEQKYRAAIALLERDAHRRRTLLEPDVQARFEQTLAAVDQTINETRRAVKRQPDDPVAVQYMLAAYAKKVEVLREIATYRADAPAMQ